MYCVFQEFRTLWDSPVGIRTRCSAHNKHQHADTTNAPPRAPTTPPRKKFTVIVLSLQVEGGTLKKEITGTIKYKFITFSLEASHKQCHKYFSKTAATIYIPPVLQNSLYCFVLFCKAWNVQGRPSSEGTHTKIVDEISCVQETLKENSKVLELAACVHLCSNVHFTWVLNVWLVYVLFRCLPCLGARIGKLSVGVQCILGVDLLLS